MPPQHKILKLALPSILVSLTSPTKNLRRIFVATLVLIADLFAQFITHSLIFIYLFLGIYQCGLQLISTFSILQWLTQ